MPNNRLVRSASVVARQWGDELFHEFSSPTQLAVARLESRVGSRNYHPLPVVLCKGKGHQVWDIDGRAYLDFLGAYSSVNQGHCHPRIVQAVREQASVLTLTSRAFYTDTLSVFEDKITRLLKFDRVLPMNTGAEAVETSIKLWYVTAHIPNPATGELTPLRARAHVDASRRWGYRVKGIMPNEARIIFMDQNFVRAIRKARPRAS